MKKFALVSLMFLCTGCQYLPSFLKFEQAIETMDEKVDIKVNAEPKENIEGPKK